MWEAIEALLIGGRESVKSVAFSSGMAAIAAVFDLLPVGKGFKRDALAGGSRNCYSCYLSIGNGLFSDSLEVANVRMGWRYIQPGATPDTNYDLVASYFISKHLEIEKEIHETRTKMMCQNGTPRYSDSTLFSVFDAFDDLNDEIYAKHLALAKINFADDDTFDLEAAFQGYAGSFSLTVVATSGAIDQVYAAAQRLCTEPFKQTFQSRHQFH